MFEVLAAAQVGVSGVVLVHGAWWTFLSAVALRRPRLDEPAVATETLPPLTVLVPAHNEERSVAATVRSLLACDYPGELEVVVIADNCTDATADVAAAAGATLLRRDNLRLRGKSFALQFALQALGERSRPLGAVAVVDADTVVSPNFAAAVGARLVSGASAVQVRYRAGEAPGDLAGLRRLALSLVHWSRPLGLARLGLGTGLKGNGMAFRWDAARVALARDGLAEDAAATLALARAGLAVTFEPRATVTGFMAREYEAARVQDARWEGGRMRLLPEGLKVALSCVRRGRYRLLPAVFEAIGLPLTLLGAMGAAAAVAGFSGTGNSLVGSAAVCSLGAYVALGLAAARPSATDLAAMRSVPRFIGHKALVFATLAGRRGGATWERTSRN